LEQYKVIASLLVALTLAACDDNGDKNSDASIPATAMCASVDRQIIHLKGGESLMGSDVAYPEERPQRRVKIAAFNIDATEVTNAQFAEFVAATGYVTQAEKPQAGFGKPGGAVFTIPTPDNPSWWRFVEGANWRHPTGPESNIKNMSSYPVVQVSIMDAKAYARWAGRRLPSEAEWEYAARAGADSLYVWGEARAPDGQEQANTWQGMFPIQNTEKDGYKSHAPVACFPANAYGLYDMIGNVWEWTDTIYNGSNANGSAPANSITKDPFYTIKGGSFLCAENFCRRYRASARQAQEAGFSTNHIGFRTVQSDR
jgi:formylglycine-generating enzyme required for sulfatase activity